MKHVKKIKQIITIKLKNQFSFKENDGKKERQK